MGGILTFFFIVILSVLFITRVLPTLMKWWLGRFIAKKMNSFQSNMNKNNTQEREQNYNNNNTSSSKSSFFSESSSRRKYSTNRGEQKIFAETEGEYVAFEEIIE